MRGGRTARVTEEQGRVTSEIFLRPVDYVRDGVLREIPQDLLAGQMEEQHPHGFDAFMTGGFCRVLDPEVPVMWMLDRFDERLEVYALNTIPTIQGVRRRQGVRYPNAWPAADLEFEYAGHLVRKLIRLQAGHPLDFSFRFNRQPTPGRFQGGMAFRGIEVPPPYLVGPEGETVALRWKRSGLNEVTVELPVRDWAGWVLDPTLTLQPDATAGKDTSIWQEFSNGTSGGEPTSTILEFGDRLVADRVSRPLLQFDLSTILPGSTITSAILSLWKDSTPSSFSGITAGNFYRLLKAWVEATATWANYDTALPWTGPGASGVGTDFNTPAIGSIAIADDAPAGTRFDVTLTSSLIQEIIPGGTLTNNGFVLRHFTAGDLAEAVRSSDHATAAERPKLVVVYDLPVVNRLAAYSVNLWDPKGIIRDRNGNPVDVNELHAGPFIELLGADLPGTEVYPNFFQDPSKTKISEVSKGPEGARIKASSSQFADAIVRRAAQGL